MVKNQKGFTLVEVIVVAVIVAILAAVAIRLYNGYINDSRTNVCNNIAGSVASACGATVQQDLDVPEGVTGPETIEFPSVTGIENNHIHVPDGFTVTIEDGAGTVVCSYGDDINSETYYYREQ